MTATQATIIGSRTGADGYHHIADVTSEGAVVVSGTFGVGSVSIGSVIVGNIYIQSGTNILGIGVGINTGSTGAIVANTETMAIEHTISSGSTYNLVGFDGTGTADAKFRVWHNGSLQVMLRINPAERNIQKTFSYPILYTTGSVVLTAEHTNDNSQSFDGTLYGVETTT